MKEDGYVMLSDFGVAKILPDNIQDCRSTSGTHGYMVGDYLLAHELRCIVCIICEFYEPSVPRTLNFPQVNSHNQLLIYLCTLTHTDTLTNHTITQSITNTHTLTTSFTTSFTHRPQRSTSPSTATDPPPIGSLSE